MAMEWFAPVLAVVLVVIGLILALLSLGIFLYGTFYNAKAKASQDQNPPASAVGQSEAGQ